MQHGRQQEWRAAKKGAVAGNQREEMVEGEVGFRENKSSDD